MGLLLRAQHQLLPGRDPDTVDLTAEDVEEERKAEEAAKNRKKFGLPEIDPDSLPSTNLPKLMTFGFYIQRVLLCT